MRFLTACLLAIFAFGSTANADFVIDDFSTGGDTATTVTGATVILGLGMGSANGFTYVGDGYEIDFNADNEQLISYDFGALTIAEAYGIHDPYANTMVNNNIDVITLPFNFGLNAADFSLEILLDDAVHLTVPTLEGNYTTIDGTGITGANKIGFNFIYNGTGTPFAPFGTLGGGGTQLFANPEPTSALMLGAVGLLGLIRRRKA